MLLLASAEGPDFLHLTPVPVESVVVDALDRWGHTPRHWRLGPVAETTVLGDRDRLAVALDALLENAVAHTAPGDRIEVGAQVEGEAVALAVTDSGCGIQDADLQRIFKRFARAEPHRSRPSGGLGLGLAIVQAIAEAHGGSVRVQSTFGHGSKFEVLLPLAPASPGSAPRDRATPVAR
jgi:signal transduction histidine kinase